MAGRAYSSVVHQAIARAAAERAHTNAPDAIVAILFSAFWFEGMLNEIADYLVTAAEFEPQLEPYATDAVQDSFRDPYTTIAARVNAIASPSGQAGTVMDLDQFRRVALLFRIRNALVHRRPDVYLGFKGDIRAAADGTKDRLDLIRQLATDGVLEMGAGVSIQSFTNQLAQPRAGEWAYATAADALQAIARLLPVSQVRNDVEATVD